MLGGCNSSFNPMKPFVGGGVCLSQIFQQLRARDTDISQVNVKHNQLSWRLEASGLSSHELRPNHAPGALCRRDHYIDKCKVLACQY